MKYLVTSGLTREDDVDMSVISFYNIKGGVGKTTFAVNIASEAARSGLRTVLWDLDPQASATFILRSKPKLKNDFQQMSSKTSLVHKSIKATNWSLLDLLPADFEQRKVDRYLQNKKHPSTQMKSIVEELENFYDVIVLDCPPEASLVSENIVKLSTLICSPVLPNAMSLNTLELTQQFANKIKPKTKKLYSAFNQVDLRKNLHKNLLNRYLDRDPRFLKTVVPASAEVENMTINRSPIGYINSHSRAASAFRTMTEELFELMS